MVAVRAQFVFGGWCKEVFYSEQRDVRRGLFVFGAFWASRGHIIAVSCVFVLVSSSHQGLWGFGVWGF